MYGSNRIVLAHFWADAVRNPLHGWIDPEHDYRAVTAHGTALSYVIPTLVGIEGELAKIILNQVGAPAGCDPSPCGMRR